MTRLCSLLLLGAVACVPPYRPPTAAQPHAVVKLRRSYDTTAGASLRESVQIDEHSALEQSVPVTMVSQARTDAILVHPIPSTFTFRSVFYHVETRLVRESYQVPKTRYVMESYDCGSGFGTNKTFRTCTRSVPRTEYETRYRDVWQQVQVTDAACNTGYRFAPRDQRVYLLQHTYQAQSVCSLTCFEQVLEADGTFKNLPCPAAPPEQ